jgi:hypothetical protein
VPDCFPCDPGTSAVAGLLIDPNLRHRGFAHVESIDLHAVEDESDAAGADSNRSRKRAMLNANDHLMDTRYAVRSGHTRMKTLGSKRFGGSVSGPMPGQGGPNAHLAWMA